MTGHFWRVAVRLTADRFGLIATIGLVVALMVSLGVAPALAERRVALIVANGDYKSAPLANPVVDAALVEASLRSIGFEVAVATNVDLAGFDTAVTTFSETAKGADIALFYFAGHGFAVNDGIRPVSVLMATSADVTSRSERILRSGGIALDDIVQTLASKASTTLVFVDACRNDPRVRVAGGGGRGLSRIEAVPSSGLFIGLSTRLGEVAADGDEGKGSPFARAFAGKIGVPGLRIDDAFADIRETVRLETGNKQAPDIVQNDLPRGAVILVAEGAATVEEPAARRDEADQRLAQAAVIWSSIERSTTPADFVAFKERFRGTFYEELAESRLKALAAIAPAPEAQSPAQLVQGSTNGTGEEPARESADTAFAELPQRGAAGTVGLASHVRVADLGDAPDPRLLRAVETLSRYEIRYGVFRGNLYIAVLSWGATWDEARQIAENVGGHLVTIGDKAENRFVYDLFAEDDRFVDVGENGMDKNGPFIGLFQPKGSKEPKGGWQWVTGEKVTYTNWNRGQPNNYRGKGDVGVFYSYGAREPDDEQRVIRWDDYSSKDGARGFIIEIQGRRKV